jgi:hypothetical protein
MQKAGNPKSPKKTPDRSAEFGSPDRGVIKRELNFFNGNSAFFTDLDTALTAQAFFGIYGYGFAVLHFKDFNRAHIHAFFAASALFFVDDRIKSHYNVSFRIRYLLR